MTRRRRAAWSALAAVAVYLVGAALSGWLSPLARRPLLDGLTAPPPYNYVDPPPGAQSGRRPDTGVFQLRLGPNGSVPDVLATADVQFTLVADRGMLPPNAGDARARIVAEPLDPDAVEALPEGLAAQGNVYRTTASYEPSGDPVAKLARPAQVILVYPGQPGPHQRHSLLFSADGRRWQALETTDAPSLQQAAAEVGSLGYVVAAAPPVTPAPRPGDGGIPVVVWVIGASLLLVGLGLATRILSGRDAGRGASGARSSAVSRPASAGDTG